MKQGAIWRLNEDFDYEMLRFSVRDVLDGKDDKLLKPQDIVYLYSEKDVQGPAIVSIQGHVRNPGDYTFVEDMSVQDIVLLAGDLLPGAYTQRAEVLRLTPDQRRMIIPIELSKAMDGDPQENIVLRRSDIVQVLSRDEVTLRSTVYIDGYIKNSGSYHRYEGMRVSDLIIAAGGLNADVGTTIQYTSGRFEGPSKSQTLILKGTPSEFVVEPDLLLKDDDHISVMGTADFTIVPKIASIAGRVANPGSYPLRLDEQDDEADTIYDLIQRGGGLLEDANPKGMILYRFREEILPEDRQVDLNYVISMFNREAGETATALATEQQKEILASSMTQQFGDLLGSANGALLVVPPRRIGISQWIRAIPIDGAKIMATKGAEGNMDLHHGDILRVPKMVDFVTVIGSVSSPGALPFIPNHSPKDYVDRAGGAMPDASLPRMIVMRANGAASQANTVKDIEAGDVIIVPSQHMFRTGRIKAPWSETFLRLISIAAATILF